MIKKTILRRKSVYATEYWYGLTSANRETLPPQAFLNGVRGHWSVENSLHHVKDRSWLEDKIYSKETNAGLVLGILRNLSLNLIRHLGRDHKIKSMPKRALNYLLNPLDALRLLSEN